MVWLVEVERTLCNSRTLFAHGGNEAGLNVGSAFPLNGITSMCSICNNKAEAMSFARTRMVGAANEAVEKTRNPLQG